MGEGLRLRTLPAVLDAGKKEGRLPKGLPCSSFRTSAVSTINSHPLATFKNRSTGGRWLLWQQFELLPGLSCVGEDRWAQRSVTLPVYDVA